MPGGEEEDLQVEMTWRRSPKLSITYCAMQSSNLSR
jgi:hypothetical protein